jgi:hypothetical protein
LSQKLSRLIGMPRAMAVSLAGQALTGEAAYRVGLVSHLVPLADLLPLAWKMAGAIAALDPAFVADLKRLMKHGASLPLAEALALERETHRQWARTAQLGPIQARTGAVMAGNRAALVPEAVLVPEAALVRNAAPVPQAVHPGGAGAAPAAASHPTPLERA